MFGVLALNVFWGTVYIYRNASMDVVAPVFQSLFVTASKTTYHD